MTEIAESPMDTDLEYDVVLATTDGVESTIRCGSGTTLLEAAEDSGLVLKSSCQNGGCGACSATLSRGRVEMGDHDPDVIETPESEGGILLCRSFPREDCRVDLPYDRGQVVTAPPARHQARIIGLDQVADAVMRLRPFSTATVGRPPPTSSPASSSASTSPEATPGARTRRPTSPTGTVNWSSTSGCCPAGRCRSTSIRPSSATN
mgnify:CR=1 FL=1